MHNHDRLPPEVPPLSKTVTSAPIAMRAVGTERKAILATVHHMLGHAPTEQQIATILGNDGAQPLAAETEELMRYMFQING